MLILRCYMYMRVCLHVSEHDSIQTLHPIEINFARHVYRRTKCIDLCECKTYFLKHTDQLLFTGVAASYNLDTINFVQLFSMT